VFVDAPEEQGKHERGAIHIWIEWMDEFPNLDFRLFNLDNFEGEHGRESVLAKYQGEVLFSQRDRFVRQHLPRVVEQYLRLKDGSQSARYEPTSELTVAKVTSALNDEYEAIVAELTARLP
jgi:hypothetical protein